MLPTSVKVRPLAAASRRSNRTRNHRDINKWHSALRRGLTVTTVTRGLRICDPLDTCWWTCVHPFLSEMCREERYCLSVFPLRASVCAARRGTVRLRGYAGFLFGIVECFVRVVVGSLRDHTAHMNSLVFQTALSSCDCSLTAVCADARLCEQLLPATATLQDLTHCPERSATGCLRHYAGRARRGKDLDDRPEQPEQERRFRRRPMRCLSLSSADPLPDGGALRGPKLEIIFHPPTLRTTCVDAS